MLKFNPPLSPRIATLAEIFKEHGYVTQGFSSSNGYLHPQLGYGRGFDDYVWGLGYIQATSRIIHEVNKWLDENARQNKFFIFIHDNDTHEPFNAPEPFNSLWGEEYIDRYDGEISHVDHYFGKILDKIEELGIKEKTLVIYASDHGTEFWEHGFLEKKVNLYNEILHVPLVMSCPTVLPEGKVVKGLIATVDIVPTILDILNLPPKKDSQGRSFLPLIQDAPQARPREPVFSHTEHNNPLGMTNRPSFEHLSVHTETYKFIRAKILLPFKEDFFEIQREGSGNWVTRFRALAERTGMDPEKIKQGTVFRELYDLRTDPKEQKNIMLEKPGVAADLEKQLDLWVKETRRQGAKLAVTIPEMKKPKVQFMKFPWTEQRGDEIIPKCPVPIRVNAGGREYVDKKDQTWLADRPYSFGKWGYVTRTYADVLSTSEKVEGTEDPSLYQSQRFSQSFAYLFDVPNGKYRVNLLFAETLMDMGGLEFFNVHIQDRAVLTSYNIFNDAGGRNKAVRKTFVCKVNKNQLSIRFEGLTEPQQEAAKVSGIEILPFAR